MTAALASISPAGWVCILLGSWIVLACVGSAGLCAVAACLKRKPKPKPVRATYPPPVPPTQAEIDALWLAPWPTNLTDQQVDRLFDDIVAIEGLDR